MEVYRRSSWLLVLLGFSLLTAALQGVQGEAESAGPTESECRPYIEKALKELEQGEAAPPDEDSTTEDLPTVEITTDDSDSPEAVGDGDDEADGERKNSAESAENEQTDDADGAKGDADYDDDDDDDDTHGGDNDAAQDDDDDDDGDSAEANKTDKNDDGSQEDVELQEDVGKQEDSKEAEEAQADQPASAEGVPGESSKEDQTSAEAEGGKSAEEGTSAEAGKSEETQPVEEEQISAEVAETVGEEPAGSAENTAASEEEKDASAVSKEENVSVEGATDVDASKEDDQQESKEDAVQLEDSKEDVKDDDSREGEQEQQQDSNEDSKENEQPQYDQDDEGKQQKDSKEDGDSKQDEESSKEAEAPNQEQQISSKEDDGSKEAVEEQADSKEVPEGKETVESKEAVENKEAAESKEGSKENDGEEGASAEDAEKKAEVEELIQESEEDLTELRSREHIAQLLKLDEESSEVEKIADRTSEIILRDLKKLYENAIKPLEALYKYRDLSNRHFGDAEIFSKPLILFMGPWSGGKSTIINYLLGIEYNETTLHTGAEPSPAYFNILTYGSEIEILDGTELAADYTFSGLQKFGQGLEERLRGYKLPSDLLKKVNIVEIPGILEVRKQVSRVFPFNDACQWFIDRADIIFLVYDPSKLDVGPETEAILDQLKGREHQTRIILNKADQVKPEELMRVQGALIWNISPLMSSAQPPAMYTTSLWSKPFESWAPVKLLQAQERAFLRDLRSAIDKRIDNKIASARRFAVRVRNHAKMVDCYLTTYYNHKSVFGNRKQISDEIINHPQDYHIYEGLSTLTNISRYDLPDPDVYKDFFRLNALYDFQQLSSTCTYFRGCPINRLDVAIAYDLPELVGKHKRLVEAAVHEANAATTPGS